MDADGSMSPARARLERGRAALAAGDAGAAYAVAREAWDRGQTSAGGAALLVHAGAAADLPVPDAAVEALAAAPDRPHVRRALAAHAERGTAVRDVGARLAAAADLDGPALDTALEGLDRDAAALTADGDAAMRYAHLLQRAGRLSDACAVLERMRETPSVLARRGALQIDLDRRDAAQATAARLQAIAPNRPATTLLAARLVPPDAALAMLTAATEAHPRNVPLAAAYWQALSDAGRTDAAEAAIAAFTPPPAQAAQGTLARAAAFRALGDPDRAIAALGDMTDADATVLRAEIVLAAGDAEGAAGLIDTAWPEPPARLRRLAAKAEAAAGLYDRARARLAPLRDDASLLRLSQIQARVGDARAAATCARVRPDTARKRGGIARTQALIAEAEGRDLDALTAAEAAVAATPDVPASWDRLTAARLAVGEIDGAWQSQLSRTRARAADDDVARPMHAFLGQIVNEYRLLMPPDLAHHLHPQARGGHAALLAAARAEPGNPPAAIGVLQWQKRAGLPTAAADGPPRIPRLMWQFWDAAQPPAAVARLMEQNRRMAEGWGGRRFDLASGAAYLAERGEQAARRAYRLSPTAAGKADILRLAVLYHEGGLYLDADDRLTASPDAFVDRAARLFTYQEPLRSLGNNVLAAEPGHPVLRHALDEASTAFSGPSGESVWLATGPGALTRAVVAKGLSPEGRVPHDLRIVPHDTLSRFVAMHVRLPYKETPGHWLNAQGHR